MNEAYQEIEKILLVLSPLALQESAESAEKLVAGIELLNNKLIAFFEAGHQLEKNELVSLMARVDSLHIVAQQKSSKIKTDIMEVNKRLKAEKGYKNK